MTAEAERSSHYSGNLRHQGRTGIGLYCCAGILVVVVGVMGLFDGSWSRPIAGSWVNIHALFGLQLCGFVIARFYWQVKRSPVTLAADIRDLSRHLSRVVYLLLYVIFGVREIIVIVNVAWHGDAFESLEPNRDFQFILAYGLAALAIIRALAFEARFRSVDYVASKAMDRHSDK